MRLVALLFALALSGASHAESCLQAFDFGSSGIRVGQQADARPLARSVDYFHVLSETDRFDEALPVTLAAVRRLSAEAPADCLRLAGGFSVWRRAAERDPRALASTLAKLERLSGIRLLVIPQATEANYGYVGSRALLGEKLLTHHVLDLGGGSLQVASAEGAFGVPLGQKSWHDLLCHRLRGTTSCTLQPWSSDALETARGEAQRSFALLPKVFTVPFEMTAVSRPVTRAVVPAVNRLTGGSGDGVLTRRALGASIQRLATLSPGEIAEATGVSAKYADFLVSDMVLLQALLEVSGGERLLHADIVLTNVPGLLGDDKARRWAQDYTCYLWRLGQGGEAAFLTDPATCEMFTNSSD